MIVPNNPTALGAALAELLVGNISTALLFSWLFNRTQSSVLITLLLHTSYNLVGLFLPRPIWSMDTLLAALLARLLMRPKRMAQQQLQKQPGHQ